MASYFSMLIKRFRALRRVTLRGETAAFLFSNDVQIIMEPGARIVVNNASVSIGYPLPTVPPFASYQRSFIYLGKDSCLVFNGAAVIGPGATIRINDGGTATFGGRNHIGHNFTLLCDRRVEIGEAVATSWNVTLIDDDRHSFRGRKGELFKAFYRPLILERNVGIQMNVQIPRGIVVGENSVICAGTIARRDIPANSLAYQETELRIREGISAPAS